MADDMGVKMNQTAELRTRVEAKKKKLEADLVKAKAEAKGGTNDTAERITHKLEELKVSIGHGWDNLSEGVSKKLNDWLK